MFPLTQHGQEESRRRRPRPHQASWRGCGHCAPAQSGVRSAGCVGQGAIFKDDDRLILVVRVQDAGGAPVTGLKKASFKWWQMGHFFGEFSSFFVVELLDIPGCEGLYHLVQKNWSTVGNGTIPFFVRVQKRALRHGGALTFILKCARDWTCRPAREMSRSRAPNEAQAIKEPKKGVRELFRLNCTAV